MASNNVFPAFIRTEIEGGNAFAQFTAQGEDAAATFTRHFRGAAADVSRLVEKALAAPRNSFGALDLGTGKFREAAQAAEQRAAALRELATATSAMAAKEGELTSAQQAHIAATHQAAAAAEMDAQKKREQASMYDRFQAELNETAALMNRGAAATGAFAHAQGVQTQATGAQRMAMIQGSQQFQDFIIQVQAGGRPLTALSQQGSQLAFVLSGLEGKTGSVARFFAGPWGVAVFAATAVLGGLVTSLFDAGDAADDMGERQSALASMVDFTTGRIKDQISAVQALAEAQRQGQALEEARERYRASRSSIIRQGLAAGRPTVGAAEFGLRAQYGQDFQPAQRTSAAELQIRRLTEQYQRAEIDANRFGQAVDRIGKADPSVRRLTDALVELSSNTVTAARDVGRTEAAIAVLSGTATDAQRNLLRTLNATSGSAQARSVNNLIEAESKLATATTARERAQARLQVVQAKQGSITDQNSAEARRYRDELDGANRELQSAIAAERGAAEARREARAASAEARKAAREAAKEERELERALIATLRAFDPAASAARDYAEALGRIAELQAASAIDEVTAATYRSAAAMQAFDAETKAGQQHRAEVLQRLTPYFTSRMDQPLADIRRGMESAGAAAGDALRDSGLQAVDAIADALGGKLGRTVSAVIALLSTAEVGGRGAGMGGLLGGLGVAPGARGPMVDLPAGGTITLPRIAGGFEQGLVGVFNPLRTAINDLAGGIHKFLARNDSLAETLGSMAGHGMLGGIAGRMTGSGTAGAIGGVLGGVAGKAIGKALSSSLGSLGSAMGPIGSIAGGLLGGALGGLLSSTPRASSTIGVGPDGRLQVASTTGSRSLQAGTIGAADSAIATIERIAEALGATILPGVGAVSIGQRKGNWMLDPTGRGQTKEKKGAINFGQDANAAVRAATLDLIRDGILAGLRAGTQRLLQNAKDIEAGLSKALRFESVFTRLQEHLDPVGAAIDRIDKEFSGLRNVFQEAGASLAEYSKLEQLYGIERAKAIREAGERMTSTLRSLLDDLMVKNDAWSLRDRLAMARQAFDPLADAVRRGEQVDAEAFAEAGRNMLDIMRQLSGSTSAYFNFEDELRELTSSALSERQTLLDEASKRAPLMGGANDNGPVIGAIDHLGNYIVSELGGHLHAVNINLGRLIAQGGGAGGGRAFEFDLGGHNF